MAKRGGFPGGMPGNMNNLMKQAQRMQRQMEEAQKELEEKEVTATAGGGAVEVTVSGKHEVIKIKLSEEVVDPDDIESGHLWVVTVGMLPCQVTVKLPEPNDLPSLCRSVLISVTFSEPITPGSVSQETLTVMLLGPKNMGEPSSLMVTSQVPSADFAFTMRCDISVCIHMRVQPPAQISAIARMICSTMCAALCEYPSVINSPRSCHHAIAFNRSLFIDR